MLSTREYLLKLEYNLMLGGGRWVADFIESFWDYPVGDVTFGLFIRGGMRPKGFALSKLAAAITMPNYRVACFGYAGDSELRRLSTILNAMRRYMKEQETQWSWLVIPGESTFSPQTRATVEKNDTRELGIALVDLSAQEVITNRSYVGRRMGRFVRCFK
jgi:hypothetical protein